MRFLKSKKQMFAFFGLSFLMFAMVFSVYYLVTEQSFDDRGEASSPASNFRPLSWEVSIANVREKFTESEPNYRDPQVHNIFPGEEIKVSLFLDTQGASIDGLEMNMHAGTDGLKYENSKFIDFAKYPEWKLENSCNIEVLGIGADIFLHCFFLESELQGKVHLVDLFFSAENIDEYDNVFAINDIEFSYAEGFFKPPLPNHFNRLYFSYKLEQKQTEDCKTSENCSRIAPFEICFKGSCYKGDVNNDGKINITDFAEFKKDYLEFRKKGWVENLKRSDLNGDKKIGMADYSIFVRSYRAVIARSPSCGNNFIDSRDEQVYPTVQIGTQCWMAKNLNFADHAVGASWCYENKISNCDVYGRLYNWSAAMNGASAESSQGICPSGWHLPSDLEQNTLGSYLSKGDCYSFPPPESSVWDCSPAGTMLKASSWGGDNSSGFSALPGGDRGGGGTFYGISNSQYPETQIASFWSSSSGGPMGAWYRNLGFKEEGIFRGEANKVVGFSVRCIKTGGGF